MVKVINIDTKTKTIHISNADGDIKTWRTTESGTHFPIREGESTKEALDKFVEKKRPETKKENPNSWTMGDGTRIEVKGDWVVRTDKNGQKSRISKKEWESLDDYGDAESGPLTREPSWQPDSNPETEFQEAFMKTKWTAGNGYATYTDGNWRFEISRDGDEYISAVTSADDFDGSGVEEEESFSTLADARKHAEQMIEEYAGDTEEERVAKVPKVRNIVRGSFQFEKVGKVFRLTGYYSGDSVDLDFEKLTGHRPGSSVRYEADGNKITISDYYGAWEKEIDFDELSDEEIAEMIIK